jgi:AbrB family looped-hinge helix DNA binding protein
MFGHRMETVTLSSQFQVEIPLSIREEMGLEPGEKFRILRHGNCLELMPVRPITEYRGMFPGIDTDIDRDDGLL